MKLKTALVLMSIAINLLLGWHALRTGVYTLGYNAGVQDCNVSTGNSILSQLNESGQLTLQTQEGEIVLIPKKNDTEPTQ